MKSKLLIFGSKNFNNLINEVREFLGYSLIFYDFSKKSSFLDPLISTIIVESSILNKKECPPIIKKFENKPILLLVTLDNYKECNYNEKVLLPISFFDFKNKIIKISTAFKFSINSTLKIKEYILDKNEKKIKKNNIFISITEREVHLIELLYNQKKPLTKSYILKKIWNYSENADTHTVETHIYRLRKKIYARFNDDKFILSGDKGYII